MLQLHEKEVYVFRGYDDHRGFFFFFMLLLKTCLRSCVKYHSKSRNEMKFLGTNSTRRFADVFLLYRGRYTEQQHTCLQSWGRLLILKPLRSHVFISLIRATLAFGQGCILRLKGRWVNKYIYFIQSTFNLMMLWSRNLVADPAPGRNSICVGCCWVCDGSLWLWLRVRDHPVTGFPDARHAVQCRDWTALELVQHICHRGEAWL